MPKKRSENIRVPWEFAQSLREFSDLSGVSQIMITQRLARLVPVVVESELKVKKHKLDKISDKPFWSEFKLFKE